MLTKGACREEGRSRNKLPVEKLIKYFSENLGAKYIEENDKLKNDSSARVPDEVRRRCLKLIEDYFK